jgi:hypothetical protein
MKNERETITEIENFNILIKNLFEIKNNEKDIKNYFNFFKEKGFFRVVEKIFKSKIIFNYQKN